MRSPFPGVVESVTDLSVVEAVEPEKADTVELTDDPVETIWVLTVLVIKFIPKVVARSCTLLLNSDYEENPCM